MSEAHVWIGIQDVTVVPDGGDTIAFKPVSDDGVELEVTVEDLVFKSASGYYDHTVVTTHISYQLTLTSKEINLTDLVNTNVGVNGNCTVAWTLVAKGGASENRTYSLDAKQSNEPGATGTDGGSATSAQLVFRGIATDGTTSPLTRP